MPTFTASIDVDIDDILQEMSEQDKRDLCIDLISQGYAMHMTTTGEEVSPWDVESTYLALISKPIPKAAADLLEKFTGKQFGLPN